jgi:hypothetical protein
MRKAFKILAIFLLVIYGAMNTTIAASATTKSSTSANELAIERLMQVIQSAKKPLPAWAADMAMRAYRTWKTYKNGERVEQVQAEVIAMLKIVAEIKEEVDAGRDLNEREYRLTRELLDSHDRMLRDLIEWAFEIDRRTLDTIRKLEAAKAEAKVLRARTEEMESRLFRGTCGERRYWKAGQCVEK